MLSPLLRRCRHAGFSMIELVVVMAIMGVLALVGLPSLASYLQNGRIMSTAKNLVGGVQRARAEAIRLNQTVEFMLTDTPVSSTMAANAAASTTGANWLVRYLDPSTNVYQIIAAKSGIEGAGSSSGVVVTGTVGSVLFNGLGATQLPTTSATIDVTNPAGGQCAPYGSMRCQRIVVSPGGQVRLCDPAVTLNPADTRSC